MTIQATLTFEEAAGRHWDLVVVGAGPAGGLAARQLARKGLSVLLVDKSSFPRWKVCGSCLNSAALATLAAVGLDDLPLSCRAVPLLNVKLATPGREALVPLPGGVSLSRAALDAAIIREAIQAGAAFLPQTQAILGETLESGRQIFLRRPGKEEMVFACLVLAADGLGGQFLASQPGLTRAAEEGSRIGAGAIVDSAPAGYGPGQIHMAVGKGGYVGLVRLEDGRLNIAAALDRTEVKTNGGPARAAARILDGVSWPAIPGIADLGWRGTPALTRRPRRPAAERLFLLGDAAGYIEPFTGEGMAWALAGAVAVTPLAEAAVRNWNPSHAGRWCHLHGQMIHQRHRVCRIVTQGLRHPTLVSAVVTLLSLAPGLAAPLVHSLNKPLRLRPLTP